MLIFLGQVQFTLGLSLRSEVGIGSKPDGCALIVSPPPCRIVAEVELTSHPFTPPDEEQRIYRLLLLPLLRDCADMEACCLL